MHTSKIWKQNLNGNIFCQRNHLISKWSERAWADGLEKEDTHLMVWEHKKNTIGLFASSLHQDIFIFFKPTYNGSTQLKLLPLYLWTMKGCLKPINFTCKHMYTNTRYTPTYYA